ncbi:MAG: transglutaminase domain-containing protein [Thermoflexales bacterium]|nr:transglutaminase domain-containing protein [Thermoflexales bacterium]
MRQERTAIDWTTFILVFIMITLVLWAMIAADWADDLYTVWGVAVGGLVAGLALATSRFKSWIAHGFSAVYGLAWEVYLLSWQVSPQDEGFRERLVEIYRRLSVWLWQVTHNEIGRDSLIFVLWMAFLAWWVAYIAVWYSQRTNRVWRVVLPSGLILLVNLYYYVGSALTLYLLLFLVVALLLIVRSYAVSQEQDWRQNWVSFTPDFRFDVLQAGFTLALAVVLLGWALPAAASSPQAAQWWRRVEGPWRTVEDSWNRAFSSLRSRGPVYANPFGRFLALQGARILGDDLVMGVVSSRPSYWRATAYDHYTGSGWVATDLAMLSVDGARDLYPETPYRREPVTQTFAIYREAVSIVFAASQPYWFSIPLQIEGWLVSGQALDPAMSTASRAFVPGTGYQVVSWVSTADVDSLRQAGQDYPSWVQAHFLGLPEALPDRVRELAQAITAPYDNAYDKATALEQWMRENVSYDNQIAQPPSNRDLVEYLLFDTKRGYCDYYASGMTVLARSVGLPARVVAGFAQGTLDERTDVYRVQEKDSHSWVEIYFPRYGWIPFEPTSSRPVVIRPTPPPPTPTPDPSRSLDAPMAPFPPPLGPDELEDIDPGVFEGDTNLARATVDRRLFVIGLVTVGLLILAVAWLLIWAGVDSWSLHPIEALLLVVSGAGLGKAGERLNLYGLSTVQRAYARLMRLTAWLDVTLSPHDTPHERGELFGVAMPEGRAAIQTIVGNYSYEQYGRGVSGGDVSRQAWEAVRAPAWRAGWNIRKERLLQVFRGWRDAWLRFSRQFE